MSASQWPARCIFAFTYGRLWRLRVPYRGRRSWTSMPPARSASNFAGLFVNSRTLATPRAFSISTAATYSRSSAPKPSTPSASTVSRPCSCSVYARSLLASPMSRPSWLMYSSTPPPDLAMCRRLPRSCSPQSQRRLPNRSPVRQAEWMRTGTGSGHSSCWPTSTATCPSNPCASRKKTKRAYSASASGTIPSLTCVTRTSTLPASSSIWVLVTDSAAPFAIASRNAEEPSGSTVTLTTAGSSRPSLASVRPPTSTVVARRTSRGSIENRPLAIARWRICSGPSPFNERLTPRAPSMEAGGANPIDSARWRVTARRKGPSPRSISSAASVSPSTVAIRAPGPSPAVTYRDLPCRRSNSARSASCFPMRRRTRVVTLLLL